MGSAGSFLFFYTVFLFKNIGKGTLAPWSEKQKLDRSRSVSLLPKSYDFRGTFYTHR